MRGRIVIIGLLILVGGAAVLRSVLLRDTPITGHYADLNIESSDAAAMCPWRTPESDLHQFFGSGTIQRQETRILSSYRLEIIKRLGANSRLESNALYVHTIERGNQRVGTVLVRRARGEFGAVEIVVALDSENRIRGVRIQRHREPPPVASIVTSAQWLAAFDGKTADSAFVMGKDLLPVPPAARTTAEVVARTIRALLIENDVACQHQPTHNSALRLPLLTRKWVKVPKPGTSVSAPYQAEAPRSYLQFRFPLLTKERVRVRC